MKVQHGCIAIIAVIGLAGFGAHAGQIVIGANAPTGNILEINDPGNVQASN